MRVGGAATFCADDSSVCGIGLLGVAIRVNALIVMKKQKTILILIDFTYIKDISLFSM